MTHARAERAAISDLLDQVGPDAPTLCEGWTTADLTAHIVLRENRPHAALGVVVKPLAGYTKSTQDKLRDGRPYSELVDTIRQGPPKWSPYSFVPGLDALVNTLELLIHHEDVLRAQPGWKPRTLPAGEQEHVWKSLSQAGRLLFRESPVGLVLRHTDGRKVGVKKAEPRVVVTGDPVELLLVAFGRQKHAVVDYEGDPAAVERLRTAGFRR
ncbi:TIGR03085 family metal-binding protein [Sphaerisporangium sp. TRM90804]|uniref:TIGR03085 family metal-binding protein n=1 Tax=Sphaerisporangium sp. TRM90804 TaxID=3031113 RepID=UPI0024484938|nr:TIGR03085 family metal-binding protein [Sphaerisporangium sp. TRM90804]MDH2428569.1 TIGR03085 family metal-binding protein [Sphaerisporangium sp. TRM90804]